VSGSKVERPLGVGEIVSGLAHDVQDLMRGEMALARAEFDEKLHRLIRAGIWLLGGALVAFAGLVVLLEGGAAALALVIPTWAALVVIGFVILVVGGLFAVSGLRKLSLKQLSPERTMRNLEKDAKTIKESV
jgi:uncharacterized membrane protein YqjE